MPSAPLPALHGYVLAGGQSSRMGRDKALLDGAEQTPVHWAIERLSEVCEEVAILSGPPDRERDAVLSGFARLVPDGGGGYDGPLAALAAALQDAQTRHARYVLLLAVDQPELPVEALKLLVTGALESRALAACFAAGDIPEPLPIVVSSALQPAIVTALQRGDRRLLPTVRAAAAGLDRASGRRAEPGFLSIEAPPGTTAWFTNLNTPDDLVRWRARGRQNRSARRASDLRDG